METENTPVAGADDDADPGWILHEAGSSGGFTGWLYHYADGTMADADGTVYQVNGSGASEPEPEPEPDPEPEPEPDPEPEPEPVPQFVEYSPSELPGHALGAVVLVASVGAVLLAFAAAEGPEPRGFLLAGGLAAVAALAWWGLLRLQPTVVAIREGVLEVSRGERTEELDLRDPAVQAELGENPGSSTWTATFARPDNEPLVITARQVKAREFVRIVEHHRRRLRRPTSA